jgi:hypothetical protein
MFCATLELRNEAEFLADKSDAERQRMARTLDLNGAKRVNLDFARIRRDDAKQDLHQCRPAGTVLAKQRVDLATPL